MKLSSVVEVPFCIVWIEMIVFLSLPTGYNGTPFIVGQGDWLGCAISGCVVIFLDFSVSILIYTLKSKAKMT